MSTTVSTPRKIAATVSANATLAKGRHTPVDATSGALTMTLPTDAIAGVELSVEKTDTSTNAVTVSGTLRGTAASTIALTSQYDARTFLSEGAGSWRPVSDHRTAASLNANYVNKSIAVYDARDNRFANIAANGTTDDFGAWNTLINSVSAAGGGYIRFRGRSRLLSAMPVASNVRIVGDGWGQSILAPEGPVSAIQQGGALNTPIHDVLFEGFEIDASAQTGNTKGIFATFMKRIIFRGIWCHDSGASGLGCDFLVDTTFEDCIVEGAGRNNTTTSPGSSGFGIGNGNYDVENVTLLNCIARNNKRYGAFFEKQQTPTFNSKGPKIIGGRYEGNFRGIGDNGVRHMLIDGAHVVGNVDAGIYVGQDQANSVGYDGLITNCVVTANGTRGIHLDYTAGPSTGRYTVRGNKVHENVSTGIKVEATGTMPNVTVNDNDVFLNSGPGVQLAGGGTMVDLEVANNRIWSNGGASHLSGILVAASLTRPKITGNKINDPAGSPTQGYGIGINTGAVISGGEISRNDLRGNLTGAFSNTGTITPGASGTVMRDNLGYNPIGWDAVVPSASPWTYQAGPTDEVLNLLNGTVSNVAVTDRTGTTTNVALASPASIPLSPFDTMVVTYSTTPIVKRLKK